MAYARVEDVQARYGAEFDDVSLKKCEVLLDDAAVIIDCYNKNASEDAKLLVSCRMVIRAIGNDDSAFNAPIGASQATTSALGYSQTWTMGQGATGELYLSKLDKQLLGVGSKIGSYSPLEDMQ